MNKQEFESLKEQLTNHHVKGIGNDCTSSPFYLVQVKRINWGYDQEYAYHHAIYFDDTCWHSTKDFYTDHDLYSEEGLDDFLTGVSRAAKENFMVSYKDWNLDDLWYWLDYFLNDDYLYLHGNDYWETVNWFLTKEAAEKFLASKGVNDLNYGVSDDGNTRIYIDSLYRSDEIKCLLNAIIDGSVGFITKGESV